MRSLNKTVHNRVARPTNLAGGGSHTTVRTGLVYSGSLSCGDTPW
jgi:hypothetical protein